MCLVSIASEPLVSNSWDPGARALGSLPPGRVYWLRLGHLVTRNWVKVLLAYATLAPDLCPLSLHVTLTAVSPTRVTARAWRAHQDSFKKAQAVLKTQVVQHFNQSCPVTVCRSWLFLGCCEPLKSDFPKGHFT